MTSGRNVTIYGLTFLRSNHLALGKYAFTVVAFCSEEGEAVNTLNYCHLNTCTSVSTGEMRRALPHMNCSWISHVFESVANLEWRMGHEE